ncbi:MAG: penicillin-binding protein [Bacteroidia bacterium]|nr:penicillin-binding protein [Bacteroidia bacterium]
MRPVNRTSNPARQQAPAARKAAPAQVSDHILRRIYILFALFLVFGAAILIRVVGLQLNRDYWVQREDQEQIFFKKLVADRGNILSEDGTILATSLPFYRLALDPTVLDTTRWVPFADSLFVLAVNMTQHFDAPEERDTLRYINLIRTAILNKDKHVYLHKRKLNFKELEMARTWPILNAGRYGGGLVVEKYNNERFYPMGDLARITLGRLIDDTLAQRGVEFSFNEELKGHDGYILAQKVVGNSYVPLNEFGEEAAADGYDVVTTLDISMQDVVYRALKEGVDENLAKAGTAILIEVETGKIKAIANYPETYNHAIALQVEPGSTFKTVSATALIEDGFIDACDTVDTGNGKIKFDDKEVTDHVRVGKTDFEHIFALSSNVGVSKTVSNFYQESPECFMEHLQRFGFMDVYNTQIEGEPRPQMIRPGDPEWNIATLPSLSYGYSIRVTPLQMAAFYNGIANQGKLVRPYLVSEIRDHSRPVRTYGPELINPQMCTDLTATRVRELMKAVTRYGTAAGSFRDLPFEVAGKTGTARKVKEGVGYVKEYRASFGGFFPANKPRFTLYVMLDEPQGSYISGGQVAAPIFRKIAEQVYRMDQGLARPKTAVKPGRKPAPRAVLATSAKTVYDSLGIASSEVPPGYAWVRARSNGHQVNFEELDLGDETIPNLSGMTARDALYLLERMGLKVYIQGTGKVRRQSLMPGHKPRKDATITLYLG